MSRLCVLLGVGLVALTFLVGTGASQDTKKDPPKIKGMLPMGWKDLGLSKTQVEEVYKVQTAFRAKLQDLENKIKELKVQERQELVKLLTEDQKTLLRKLVTGEDTPKKTDK